MRKTLAYLAVLVFVLEWPEWAAAQALSASDRQALVAVHVSRGGRAADVDPLVGVADAAAAKGLPTQGLTNKIREGLAKRADPKVIEAVIRQMAIDLEAADRLLGELAPATNPRSRDASLLLLAESLGGGVTGDDLRGLARQGQAPGRPPLSGDALASASKSLALIREAKLPTADGAAVVAEGARQGYRASDLVDLGREIKRRERDYQSGRATLRALRDAIARGDRPEQLFRDRPIEPLERPAATRPERPERPARPEAPERPARPEVPERPVTGR